MAALLGVLLPSPRSVSAEEASTTTTAPPANQRTLDPGIQVDADLEALTQDIGPTLGERWGGAWANPDGGITVALTDSNDVPSPLTSHPKVKVITVKHSTARLKSALEAVVVPKLNQLLAPGIEPGSMSPWPYEAGTSSKNNVVDVLVDESHESKREQIETALAEELAAGRVNITYGTTHPVLKTCGTRISCSAPFRGGIEVTASTGGNCTLGFVMRDSLGRRFQSTAGHCAGSPWSHAGRAIGSTVYTRDSDDVDFKVVQQSNQGEVAPTNWIYRNVNHDTAITTKITSPGSSLQGNVLCIEGKTTNGAACGALDQWNATADGRCCFGKMAANTCRGDSGAPVVNDGTNRAYGFVHGGQALLPTDDCAALGSFFTWVPYAEGASGYQVLLTPTTQTLAAGQRLMPGYALVSPWGNYNLIMQGDGNLVMYNSAGTPVWHTNTWGTPNHGSFAVMQTDGNLVVVRPNGTPIWNRPTGGWRAWSYLELQNDGNLVIYNDARTVSWHRFCGC